MNIFKSPKFFHSRLFAYSCMGALLGGFFHGIYRGEFIEGQGAYVTIFGAIVMAWMGIANAKEYKDKELELEYEDEEDV